jgi:asparagine synthase (glutamine-hydrolysing)
MSVQFGRWHIDGTPVDFCYLARVKATLAAFGPDGSSAYDKGSISILYHAFHTTKESRLETQPHISPAGTVITWDGRLDNRAELIRELRNVVTTRSTDVEIVSAAYEKWGTGSFAKFVGDWALAAWNENTQALVLAKDFVGIRHLYYSIDKDTVTWSTILDPLLLCTERTFPLCEEYIAGWFSFFPAAHLTPYAGINSVPPSSFISLRPGKQTITKYWDFSPSKQIRYRTDGEYEEHFRSVFFESVRRRLRSDNPILAELSGGMDSPSIVCMADTIIACGAADTPRLDTVSYYDDSEPNWNERPYFTKVEEKRRITGCHIDVSHQDTFDLDFVSDRFAAIPGSVIGRHTGAAKQFLEFMTSHQYRVLLSGIGGDEALGGVPTPIPELSNLLARGRLWKLVRQAIVWARVKRVPLLQLLCETVRAFLPPALVGTEKHKRPPRWLEPRFVRAHLRALHGYDTRLRLIGSLPSFQEQMSTLEGLRRQFNASCLPCDSLHEQRYPYLDRDLLEFTYAIPREQIVRAHQRRSLMRRALIGIVPDELLQRRRKAFIVRGPLAALSTDYRCLAHRTECMTSPRIGIVNRQRLAESLQSAAHGQDVNMIAIKRVFALEHWLGQSFHRRLFRFLPADSPREKSQAANGESCDSGGRELTS